MCIICYKPAGANFPTKTQYKTMFRQNPDGAGFMFRRAGQDTVTIKKGFMSYSAFRQALAAEKLTTADIVAFHFRIATHGGVNKEMTQPFPLSNKKRALTATTYTSDTGIMHNGIISMCNDARKLSDTAQFIAQYMTRLCPQDKPLSRRYDDITLNIIEACIGSRMLILTGAGDAHILGRGWITDGDLIFSNDSYIDHLKAWKKSRKSSALYDWGVYGIYGDGGWYDEEPTAQDFVNYCDGSCETCRLYSYCWDTKAPTDYGINSN